MKIAVTVGQNPYFPLAPRLGGLWRAGRFWPKGRTEVEVVEGAEPMVEVPLLSLREGATEQRPDPARLTLAAVAAISADPRFEVVPLGGLPSEQAGGGAA